MCGVAAILSSDGPLAPECLDRAVARLHHRGPDARGRWTTPDGRVGLGHARLSIIDLESGDQPMANEDGSLHAVVNGEFYDFERIRGELASQGHRFRTRSDSEILLHLYEETGAHCLHRLRGEFAFVLWDGRNRTLFAGRDRFGVKPLFFAEHHGTLYLASEAKALFAAGVPAAWDPETVYLGGFLRPTHHTLYRGVRSLPPGHYLVARPGGGHRIHPYWDVTYPTGPAGDGRGEREYVDGFREVLEEAVETRLRADVSVGCYLSGGLDSCAVLGLAALHHAGPVRAFTLQFDHPRYDESGIAREMAARAGADFVPIPVRQRDLADHFADAVVASETWSINAHGVAKYLLSRAVRDAGYKVVLTGEGSDEILGGYPHFRQDMLTHHTVGQDPDELERLLRELEEGNQVSRGILLPDGEADPADLVRS
ncbi:MAG TPA: asparagine synthase (glutamine-hydrolyzing), partial [Longimicrobiales bacterium]|nr:asparagine synthase (glutamine-hydrolyzing) [Longimicrobiales bacterium]